MMICNSTTNHENVMIRFTRADNRIVFDVSQEVARLVDFKLDSLFLYLARTVR
jgi:hypothetical protein